MVCYGSAVLRACEQLSWTWFIKSKLSDYSRNRKIRREFTTRGRQTGNVSGKSMGEQLMLVVFRILRSFEPEHLRALAAVLHSRHVVTMHVADVHGHDTLRYVKMVSYLTEVVGNSKQGSQVPSPWRGGR